MADQEACSRIEQRSGFSVENLSKYSVLGVRGEDPASMLTSHFSFIALLLTAAFVSGVQLVGQPIECWCPAYATDAMCNFTKSTCWISGLYVIDFEDAIPNDQDLKEITQKRELQFYPLVPFILLLLALLFKLPSFLWTAFQGEEGLDVIKAVKMATNNERDDQQSSQAVAFAMHFNLEKKSMSYRSVMHMWVSLKKLVSAWGLFPMGGELGTYQTGLFLFTRLLAVVMMVLTFPFLSYVLQMDYVDWGWTFFRWMALDGEEPHNYAFPRETLCNFHVRQMQNVHDYTVQCVLPINMWSEKAFLVLWFWVVFLLQVNLYSYQYWFRKLLFPHHRRALLAKHLAILSPDIRKTRREDVDDFTQNYLSFDCVLILRILEMAAGNRFANLVVGHLWEEYNRRRVLNSSSF